MATHPVQITQVASGEAATITQPTPQQLRAIFSTAFDTLIATRLRLSGIEDRNGNPMPATELDVHYYPSARLGHILLSEFKPTFGGTGTAARWGEFVEIYNRAPHTVSLDSLYVQDASGSLKPLPNDTLGPGRYRAFASTSLDGIRQNIRICPMPSLNDDGDVLRLLGPGQQVWDDVAYATAPPAGTSLERLDLALGCLRAGQWVPSQAQVGSTPGQPNSQQNNAPDQIAPELLTATTLDSVTIRLHFSEALNPLFQNQLGLVLDGAAVGATYESAGNGLNGIDITLPTANALVRGQLYTLTLTEVTDCHGNQRSTETQVSLGQRPMPGQLVFNELLFEPRSGGETFVELKNESNSLIDISNLLITSYSDGQKPQAVLLPKGIPPIQPGSLVWLSASLSKTTAIYPRAVPENHIPTSLPTLERTSGTVLLTIAGALIDSFAYSTQQHAAVLTTTAGISLERAGAGQWLSATQAAGWATPGFDNSQQVPNPDFGNLLTITPSVISANGDGHDDLALITLNLPGQTYYTLALADLAGRPVKQLANNRSASGADQLVWQADTDNHTLAAPGPYLVVLEYYTQGGQTKVVRKPIAVAPE